MTITRESLQCKRCKYIHFDFTIWRVKITYFKMGKKRDLRIKINLGEEW